MTTRIASVRPESRPAKKVTWGGIDVVAAAVAVAVDDVDTPPEEEGRLNRLYHPPKTSR